MSKIDEVSKNGMLPLPWLLLRGKTSFQAAFEKGNVKHALYELNQLSGTPANKFNLLLSIGISQGNTELAKEIGVEAYSILSKNDIRQLLSYKNGPSEKIALFVEIMYKKHGSLKSPQLAHIYNALRSYCLRYPISGNSLPKGWLSFYAGEVYSYNRNALLMYLKMYSTKAPSTYEKNIAAFVARLVSEDKKAMCSLSYGSYCRKNIQYEVLHALNLASQKYAQQFAEMLLERQAKGNVFYNSRVIELAKLILGEQPSTKI